MPSSLIILRMSQIWQICPCKEIGGIGKAFAVATLLKLYVFIFSSSFFSGIKYFIIEKKSILTNESSKIAALYMLFLGNFCPWKFIWVYLWDSAGLLSVPIRLNRWNLEAQWKTSWMKSWRLLVLTLIFFTEQNWRTIKTKVNVNVSNVFNYRQYKMNFVLSVWQPCRSSESREIGLWQKIDISWVGMCVWENPSKLYFQGCF